MFLLNFKINIQLTRPANQPKLQDMVTNAGDGSNTVKKKSNERVGRNDDCPCGSGKKYKNCCGKNK